MPDQDSSDLPKYQQLVRKELRLWEDQLPDLAALRRRLAAARTSRTEPITDNTLIRIAVDLLLANAERLSGNTEEELCASVVPADQLPSRWADSGPG